MTERSSVKDASASKSERLSKDDLQTALDKAEEEIETEVNGGDKREAMSLTRKRIIRIRFALMDYYK